MHEPVDPRERAAGMIRDALPGSVEEGTPPPAAAPGRPPLDLEVKYRNRRIVVACGAAAAPRVSEVLGLLAVAVLRLRASRGRRREVPVAVVVLERFGRRLEAEVRAFFAGNAPEHGWGLADSGGKGVLEIPALGVSWRREPARLPPAGGRPGRRERNLFTDLNRWMLKVLLLRTAPAGLWGGAREAPRHPTELAGVAGVSIEKAHRFTRSFEEAGFLRRAPEGLRPVRVRTLLEAWLQQERGDLPRTVDVRPLVPGRRGGGPVLPAAAAAWAVLGGAAAARVRGLLHSGAPYVPLVHVGIPVEEALRVARLEVVEPRDAVLRLRRPRHRASVFRGAVPRRGKPALADLWQMALDSFSSDPRGAEQAEFLLERVLALQEGR